MIDAEDNMDVEEMVAPVVDMDVDQGGCADRDDKCHVYMTHQGRPQIAVLPQPRVGRPIHEVQLDMQQMCEACSLATKYARGVVDPHFMRTNCMKTCGFCRLDSSIFRVSNFKHFPGEYRSNI